MNTVGVARSFARRRPLARWLRWLALAIVVPVLWACNARSVERPIVKPEQTFVNTFQQSINRDVDLLFLIDDSSSMRLSQTNLRTNFPRFIARLRDPDPPGLPNVHIAVISSDMGVSSGSWDESCNNTGGKMGNFQYHPNPLNPADPTTLCTTNLAAGATFISDDGKGLMNYTGNLADVFTCIAALGEGGCGFEHQFAAILRALGADGQPPPADNQNFLREDAYLVVVMITNEDDCSASPGIELYDTNSNTNIASVLGPNDFRCNEFGHICTDPAGVVGHPKRSPPNQDVNQKVSYTECHSDESGYLLRTKDVANALKSLKKDPSQVLVAAITGLNTPYTVSWKAPLGSDDSCGAASCPWPDIEHSCTAGDGSFADPSVRTADFVNQFGDRGLVLPICETDFSPSLDKIAKLINATLQPPCITGRVATKPGTTEPDCTVVSHAQDSSGVYRDSPLSWCGSGAAAPCWQLIPPPATATNCTGQSQIIDPVMLMDPKTTTGPAQNATVNCALCVPNVTDPARGCP